MREKKKHYVRWEEEQRALNPLPVKPFCAAKPLAVKVSSYSLITVDRNRYSVPTEYVGQNLVAKAFVDHIEVLSRNQVIASHTRTYGRGHTLLQFRHYLTALQRKPHAVTHATVVRQLPQPFQQLRERMERSHSTGYKDFLKVLLLTQSYSLEEVGQAIMTIGPYQADEASLRQYLDTQQGLRLAPEDYLTRLSQPLITEKDTHRYDRLLQEVGL